MSSLISIFSLSASCHSYHLEPQKTYVYVNLSRFLYSKFSIPIFSTFHRKVKTNKFWNKHPEDLLSIVCLLMKLHCLHILGISLHILGSIYVQLWYGDNCKPLFGGNSCHSKKDDQPFLWLLKFDRILWLLLCNLSFCCGSLFCGVLFTVCLQEQMWFWISYKYLTCSKTRTLLLRHLTPAWTAVQDEVQSLLRFIGGITNLKNQEVKPLNSEC